MPERDIAINFNNVDGTYVDIGDTVDFDDEVYLELQKIHLEALEASLPRNEWYRARHIVRLSNPDLYRELRKDPNKQVEWGGWNKQQIFSEPRLAVIRDQYGDIIGGALAAKNTSGPSGRLKPIWKPIAEAKMHTSPGSALPIVGDKLHLHLREVFLEPYAQVPLDVDKHTRVVSAMTLFAVGELLSKYDDQLKLDLYPVEGDPIDAEFMDLGNALKLSELDRSKNQIPGYRQGSIKIHAAGRVGRVRQIIKKTLAEAD